MEVVYVTTGKKKSSADQSELEKNVVSDCKADYMHVLRSSDQEVFCTVSMLLCEYL